MARRGADILVETLAAAGIRRIFSLSGNQIMPVYDACLDAGIEIVHTRHENACVFMAEAWAQLTGEVGVALVTAAPGFANAAGAVYSARCSESPVLLLSGDSPLDQDGRGAFQELDQCAVAAPLVKATARPASTAALAEAAKAALQTAASGRPGPVHLALAADVLTAPAEGLVTTPGGASAGTPPTDDALDDLRDRLAAAERPAILTGPALNRTRAGALLRDLEDATGAAVLPLESPRGLKDPALGDLAAALREADLIVSLGKQIDFTLAFGAEDRVAPGCPFVVVDAEQAALDRAGRNLGARLALALGADPRATAHALTRDRLRDTREAWRHRVAEATAARAARPGGPGITPDLLCDAVQRRISAAPASVTICDGGEFGQWAQALTWADARVINGPSGAIGGGLPQAVAAALARPDATVFALMGDGTAGFHLPEFETAVRAGARFVAVIGNDRVWNAEHQIQLRDYGPDRLIGCELTGARYDLAAAALGAHGEYVTRPEELDAALDRALASGGPACVNVEIEGLPAPAGPGH